jgi:hypothetical protein
MLNNMKRLLLALLCGGVLAACGRDDDYSALKKGFANPPESARPGVYWYFMDGNVSKEAITKDLESMKRVGIGYVVYLEVNVGVPRGTVDFLSETWQDMFGHAVRESERLGIHIILGVGPGWTGSGGPWVEPGQSMQHLVASAAEVSGGSRQTLQLPQPSPKEPFFGYGAFTPEVRKQWEDFYSDVAVLAFPAGASALDTAFLPSTAYLDIREIEERALYYRKPYSSVGGIKAHLPVYESFEAQAGDRPVVKTEIIDLTDRLQADGSLVWDVPEGKWTVMRFGSRSNGAVTRPAPLPGVGLEADKFDTAAMNAHLDRFTGQLFRHIGFRKASPKGGLQILHMDSWEMGAQNWTGSFREEFSRRRGYDPLPFYPVYAGVMVGSREESERFLWDLRQTAQELVLENHAAHIRRYAQRYGLLMSVEPYDMNPTADLELAAAADMPMCEFWAEGYGYNTSFSSGEGASVAHLLGQPVVPAESFTAQGDGWRPYPGSIKNQGEWAFASGINRLLYHTFQHQSLPDNLRPGMTMGPYGVHWDRNQTWWYLSGEYHRYVARCQFMLQQGRTVADILYLTPEGAPHVFRAPESAYEGGNAMLPDRRGYNFDGCPPSLLYRATVDGDGRIVFPGGARYRILVLPYFETMTPALLEKIAALVHDGATVIGAPPKKSPSLSDYPSCDEKIRTLVEKLWGDVNRMDTVSISIHASGKGATVWGTTLKTRLDNLYPHYDCMEEALRFLVPKDFESSGGNIRYTHRTTDNIDIWFVSNRTEQPVSEVCKFRIEGKQPELWHPVTGEMRPLPEYSENKGQTGIPLQFDTHEGYFIVFRDRATAPSAGKNFPEIKPLATLYAPWTVSFDPQWGGPESVVFDRLTDWSQHPDEGIKYYSGTAVYRQTFDLPGEKKQQLYLDLGRVKNMARVRLNGKDIGTVWTFPWRVDITGAAKAKGNTLEIEVVNLWTNRLIGDEQIPDDGIQNGQWPEWLTSGQPRPGKRFTFTTHRHYNKNSPLLESGLLGPVRILGNDEL